MTTGLLSSPLVRMALAQFGSRPSPQPTARSLCAIGAAIAGLVAICAAIACLFVAFWVALRPLFGPVGTPLLVAAGLLVFGLAALLAARVVVRKRAPSADLPPLAAVVDELSRVIADHKGPLLMSAILAGVIAALELR